MTEGRQYYYHIHDNQKHLFGKFSVTIAWGNVGSKMIEKYYDFDSQFDRDKKIKELFNKRMKEGYQIIHKIPRDFDFNSFLGTENAV
ncbi:MAG: WGR domain-containing protein [Spirochaetales bacterium]|nr:WGR domain-containing protein [Spirochaetales bacterium]